MHNGAAGYTVHKTGALTISSSFEALAAAHDSRHYKISRLALHLSVQVVVVISLKCFP